MNIEALTFRAIAAAILRHETPLTANEAKAIVQLGDLAAGADFDEDDGDEMTLRQQLGRHVSAFAGISYDSIPSPSPLPVPEDREERMAWLQKLRGQLATVGARELAYVISYLVAIGDFELAPVETDFIADLQQVLGISDDRASELVAHAAEQVTPMSGEGMRPSEMEEIGRRHE
jgi:hypothetical protein